MPLDSLGHTRDTLVRSLGCWRETVGESFNASRAGDGDLQLSLLNEELLVDGCHHRLSNASLPFVHTARRTDRWMTL